jgi:hypothetical protein
LNELAKIELFFLYLCFLLLLLSSKMSKPFTNYDLLMNHAETLAENARQQSTIFFNLLMRQSNDEFENLLKQENLQMYVSNAGNVGNVGNISNSGNVGNVGSATRDEAELLWHFAQTIKKLVA